MYVVRTEAIQDGMRLGRSISVTGHVLLNAGVTLVRSYIEPLLRNGIAALYVMDELATDVSPEDVIDTQTRETMKRDLKAVFADMQPLFGDAARRGVRHINVQLDTDKLVNSVDKMIREIQRNPEAVVNLMDIRTADEYTLSHSVNVCVLSVMIASIHGYSEKQLRDLAIGTVLHDIGKVMTPPEILNKPGKLTTEEFEIMKRHSKAGWEILRDQRGILPTASIIARQHHERWRGGGYPDGLRGEEIYKYSRICTVADVYDAMTADRVYRRGMPASRALSIMQNEMTGYFQPDLLFTFLDCIAPYPVGTMVEISEGYQAVVIDVRRGRNFRPKIRLVRRPDGTTITDPPEIDLYKESTLEILRSIEGEVGEVAAPLAQVV